jgi:CubicO group peptidase (beta-lactamase class C family)
MRRRDFALSLLSPALIKLSSARQIESVLLAADRGIDPPSSEFLQSLPLLMDVTEVPGIAMSVVRERRVVWQYHAGIADIKTRKPVSTDTLWPAASLGKPVFALAVLRLVEEKKIGLDTPLSRYLPGYTPNEPRANRITARHVLSHSSGLPNWRDDDSEQLVPQFEPGSRFRYSGEGFFYLERVVEHVVGAPFEQFMEQSVFASLGMTSSTYTWRADMPSRVVAGHDRDQSYTVFWQRLGVQLLEEASRQNRTLASFTIEDILGALRVMTPPPRTLPEFLIPNAASSLITTPADYSNFLIALLGGRESKVGLRATYDAMLSPQIRIDDALAWGLGWGLERRSLTMAGARSPSATNANFIWHWGDNGSWKNFVLAHPATRSAIVIFTNGSRGLHVAQRIVSASTGLDHAAFWWL